MKNKYKTREEYLQRAYSLLNEVAFKPNGQECPPVNISCSWIIGNRTANKKTLGACSERDASTGKINEIKIVPTVDDSFLAIDTLAHEMAHAVDNCQNGHKAPFRKICLAVGLDGNSQMTYAEAGEKLGKTIKNIIATIGEYPHKAVIVGNAKKQSTRNLKVECNKCDFSFRTSRKNVESMIHNHCLACDDGELELA